MGWEVLDPATPGIVRESVSLSLAPPQHGSWQGQADHSHLMRWLSGYLDNYKSGVWTWAPADGL